MCADEIALAAKPRAQQERETEMNGYELRMHDNVDLHMLLDRLQRNEVDLRDRLAKRAEVLAGLDAISDPLYQRYSLAVESLKAERLGVESELYRRESSVERRIPRWFDRFRR